MRRPAHTASAIAVNMQRAAKGMTAASIAATIASAAADDASVLLAADMGYDLK